MDNFRCWRTHDAADVDYQTRKVMDTLLHFCPEVWIADPRNIAVKDDHGNIGLLDYVAPQIYEPHLYFEDRGKEALDRAKKMLTWVFENTDALELHGFTPIYQKGAWLFVRKIGFKRLGLVEGGHCPCYASLMTKEMWREFYANNDEEGPVSHL